MIKEAFSAAPVNEVAINPILMLQDKLGISEEQARDLADIQVVCPVPGQDRQESLGEFMTSEHGTDKAKTIVETAQMHKEKGATPEEAVGYALGFAAVRNETGGLARISRDEERHEKPNSPEAKKKLII